MNQPIPVVVCGASVMLMGNAMALSRMPAFRVMLLSATDAAALQQCRDAQAQVVLCDMATAGRFVVELLRQMPHLTVIGLESDQDTLLVLNGQRQLIASVDELATLIRQQVGVPVPDPPAP